MTIKSLAQLSREGSIDVIMGAEAESDSIIMGKVEKLMHDKYGRLAGVEIRVNETQKLQPIPYVKIDGYDDERRVLIFSR
ncbi:hypothetical protein ISS30_01270 [bacterium]|nr:hypothetical protein [bacterium]